MTVRDPVPSHEFTSQHSEETATQGREYAHQGDLPQVPRYHHPLEATNRSVSSLSLSLSAFLASDDSSGILKSRTHTDARLRLRFPMARPRAFRVLFWGEGVDFDRSSRPRRNVFHLELVVRPGMVEMRRWTK